MTVQVQEHSGQSAGRATRSPFDLMWTIRRAVLGLLLLALGVGGIAWLTHASIDPQLETSAVSGTMASGRVTR